MIVRRDELRASKIMAERAAADPKISIVWDSVPETINGENNVTSLTVRNVKTDETTDIPVQGVFVAIGHDPRSR
jgi:thioredoxin reductase (NADPH)